MNGQVTPVVFCVVPSCGQQVLGPHYLGMARLCAEHQPAVRDATQGPSVTEGTAIHQALERLFRERK